MDTGLEIYLTENYIIPRYRQFRALASLHATTFHILNYNLPYSVKQNCINMHMLYKRSKTSSWSDEPRHDKTSNISMRLAKTQISLDIRPVWSESSLSAWRNLGTLATH